METKYKEILKFLTAGEYPSWCSKSQKQNFRQTSAKFTVKEGELFVGGRRVIKSEEEARRIFFEFHALPIGGHAGINRTRSAVSSRFYWHGMTMDIDNWIQECDKCQRVGKPLSAPQPLQCAKVSAVWELVGIGLTGPFTKTVDGFQYIMTATDYFSKWVEAFPLKTKCAAEVGRHICSMIYRYGCPKLILSDQGGEFVNQLNNQMCGLLGIERSVTTAYHPQSNGLDEKMNDNIKRALTKLVNDKQNNWDVYLDATLFSIRSKIQTTTKFSPFLLMYGREAVFPVEVPVELPLSNIILPEEKTYVTFVNEQKTSMEKIQETTKRNIETSKEKHKMIYANKVRKKHQNLVYSVADAAKAAIVAMDHSYAFHTPDVLDCISHDGAPAVMDYSSHGGTSDVMDYSSHDGTPDVLDYTSHDSTPVVLDYTFHDGTPALGEMYFTVSALPNATNLDGDHGTQC